MNHKSLTHQWILKFKPLNLTVDMTAGNGYDTLFLAQHSAQVIAIDIRDTAIENTKIRCQNFKNIEYIISDHKIVDIPKRITGLMYNLGYLPGSDKVIITNGNSTIASLNKLINQTEKFITLACYRKHPGGQEEYLAVKEWVESLSHPYEILEYETDLSPITFLIDLTKKNPLSK